jgi:hypothetical protein
MGNREVELHHAFLAYSFVHSNQGHRWHMVRYKSGSSHLAYGVERALLVSTEPLVDARLPQ